MKIGMNLLLWTDQPSVDEHASLLEEIKRWGFDGVEIPIDAVDEKSAKAFSTSLDALQLQRTAISALDAAVADPASLDPKLRKAAVDTIKQAIEKTKMAGADLICGPLFQGLGRFSGQAPQKDEWNYAVESLREAGEFAASLGIKIALEPINRFEMYLVNTVADGARFVQDVGLNNVGLLVDTHHGNIEEDHTAKAWEKVAEHIFHVHISENHRGVPGSGQAISKNIFEVLKKIGYNEWLTIEAFGQEVPGLISRLHLWRSFADHQDDAARLGIKFIKEQLEP